MSNSNLLDKSLLEKALKLYNAGKNNYNVNNTLSKKCFELSLSELNKLKHLAQFKDVVNTTEADCIKHLSSNENIFKLIDKNDLTAIRNMQDINFREINEYGNTLLHHSIAIGDIGILKELLKKGGLIDTVNGEGHTLLEYACLTKDPNIISFLIQHGANMKKHLFFRKNTKHYLNKSDIDMAILLKLIISNQKDSNILHTFKFLEKYFNLTDLIGLDNYTINDLMIGLHNLFINKDSYNTYKKILIEELDSFDRYSKMDSNGCIYNKLDIVLSSLVPFINYPFNMSCVFLVKNEIKIAIKYILNNNLNKKDFKNLLFNKLSNDYITNNLYPDDYIGIIVYNILSKINV